MVCNNDTLKKKHHSVTFMTKSVFKRQILKLKFQPILIFLQ